MSQEDKANIFEQKERLDAARNTLDGDVAWGGSLPEDASMERAAAASQKPAIGHQSEGGPDGAERPSGPVGLDIGTSHIVSAQNRLRHLHMANQLNAFFTVPVSKFSRKILQSHDIIFFELGNLFYIIGYSADSFANMFNTSTRRPIQAGLLSPSEKEGVKVVQALVSTLIQKPKRFGETICFGIPGEPVETPTPGAVTYHEQVLKMFLQSLGYSPVSINEGMATVLSELGEDDYTGFGVSMGGGMINVCLSYLSFPVVTFSLQMAGDYIDTMAGISVGEPATKIKGIKEEELDLSRDPKGQIHTALHIYYDEVIHKLLGALQRVLTASDKLPKIAKPVPIVLSGGTAMPRGCHDRFAKALERFNLPISISGVRLAEDPLYATAKGALLMALTEAD
ncbi:hypothetical protein [Solidesulfovibrio magneticus]|nr:hypothetical protein [Solidesulfovibrio magneticus]